MQQAGQLIGIVGGVQTAFMRFGPSAVADSTASGPSVKDIRWQDVAMQAGSFRDIGLDGRFYGPNHEEAGGVFERDGIAGAFSLKRE